MKLFTSQFQPGPWPGLYPDGPAMQPLGPVARSEARARALLASFLQGTPSRAPALTLFDRVDVKAKVPDPTLRAALAALHGTAGEPAIDYFLRSRGYSTVRFGGLGVQNFGRASVTADGKIEIIVNSRHQAEHPALMSATVLHAILHHDPVRAGYPEEIILNWIDGAVHMQQLARSPRLATSGTELSRYMNEWVLTITNSRAPGSSRVSLIAPRGRGVAPGSPKNVKDFWTLIHKVYEQSGATSPAQVAPAPPVLRSIMGRLLEPGAVPRSVQFSRKTAMLFSRMSDTWLTPVDRLRLSVLVGLVSMEEITDHTGLSRTKAIAIFKLAPILAAQ